ncbi:MAG: hypothetical protein H7125_12435 [Proteobacteria bacterium]|nr:hypothetical protein [Burkholderiales bacterium]
MSRRLGLLISSFDFSPVAEDEFHDWYDTEHIPERERLPGFLLLRRWLSVDDAKVSMTTYELAAQDVLRSPDYLAVAYQNNSPWTRRVGWRCIKRLRAEAEQTWPGDRLPPADAGALMVVAVNPAPGEAAALCAWIDNHVVALACDDGLLCVRSFIASAGTHRHIVTYHSDDTEATQTQAWRSRVFDAWAQIGSQVTDLQFTRCRRYVRR